MLGPITRALAATPAVAALLMAGCADEEPEQAATVPTAPTVAQPTAEVTATMGVAPPPKKLPPNAVPTQTAPAKTAPETPAAAPEQGPCDASGTIRGLKLSGIACEAALAVTSEWERQINRCNTIDDPQKPEGYKRTCEVSGFTCTAKRDIRSDARNVVCAGGSSQVRFTWAP